MGEAKRRKATRQSPSYARLGRAKAPVPTRAGASQRVQEAKQVFLLGWSQPTELFRHFARFAFVAGNRIPQANRIAVVHEAGVRSKSPEWSSSDLVPSIMDRLIGKAAAIHDLVYLIKRNLRRLL